MIPAVSGSRTQHNYDDSAQSMHFQQNREFDARDSERRGSGRNRRQGEERRKVYISLPEQEERRSRYSDRRQAVLDRRCGADRRGATHRWRIFPVNQHLAEFPEPSRVGTRLNIRV